MNVIFGEENLAAIDDRYTALELETLFIKEGVDTVTNYAIVGPDDIGLEGILTLKQWIPVHEALMEEYKSKNFDFCIQAIAKLHGNLGPFMDTFYDVLVSRITKEQENPTDNWTHIVDVS